MANLVGLDPQIRQSDYNADTQDLMFEAYGSSLSNIIAGGGTLTQSMLEDAWIRGIMNFGKGERVFTDPLVLSNYSKTTYADKQRFNLGSSAQEPVSGVDLRKMGSVAIVLFAGLAIGIVTSDYRRARFLVFLDPFDPNDYKNFGWQPAHSLLGLATGGVFGVGLGGSRQKWGNLPEAHTDFIYSVIGEELGLVGTLGVLILLGTLVYSIFRIALRASDPFSRYVCAGVGWREGGCGGEITYASACATVHLCALFCITLYEFDTCKGFRTNKALLVWLAA
jgi:hypothetical protein